MGFFGELDKAMHEDLVNFAEACEEKKQGTLGEYVLAKVLKDYIDHRCKITGYMKSEKKVWIELTWDFSKSKEESEGQKQEKCAK